MCDPETRAAGLPCYCDTLPTEDPPLNLWADECSAEDTDTERLNLSELAADDLQFAAELEEERRELGMWG